MGGGWFSPAWELALSAIIPAALAILKAKGINHCCGAHLTLREAAAAAGTPLDDLLEALAILEGKPA